MQNSKYYIQKVEEEFSNMVSTFSDIERVTQYEFHGRCTIYFEEICDALIQFVNINNQAIQGQGEGPILQGFKILRRLVEKENKMKDPKSSYE